jgi:hypothetical protein
MNIFAQRNRALAAALRSGEFKQGRGQMSMSLATPLHCCLGVACELHRRDPSIVGYPNYNALRRNRSYPPRVVQVYYGWDSKDPHIQLANGKRGDAAWFNDEGVSFEQIATGFDNLADQMEAADTPQPCVHSTSDLSKEEAE